MSTEREMLNPVQDSVLLLPNVDQDSEPVVRWLFDWFERLLTIARSPKGAGVRRQESNTLLKVMTEFFEKKGDTEQPAEQ